MLHHGNHPGNASSDVLHLSGSKDNTQALNFIEARAYKIRKHRVGVEMAATVDWLMEISTREVGGAPVGGA